MKGSTKMMISKVKKTGSDDDLDESVEINNKDKDRTD